MGGAGLEPKQWPRIKQDSDERIAEANMAGPLHPDNLTGGRDRRLGRGHGTEALGPSDSSDTGSDLHGAPGLAAQSRDIDGFGLDKPPETDLEEGFANYTAGPDVGDANLDGDSDSGGTGETATVPRDLLGNEGADIDTDHIERIPEDAEKFEGLDEEEEAKARRR